MLNATYLLPIRLSGPPPPELTAYLEGISRICPVLVVDNSEPGLFEAVHQVWSSFATHLAPDPTNRCVNGKVGNVVSGLARVGTELAVIADDDVRYSEHDLARVVNELQSADLVIPQNYFEPVPWHAAWDTGRILLNRVSGGDFPGTLGVRVEFLRDGYDGDVMFENLELIRTVTARGGRVRRCDGLYVRRLPPSLPHFFRQRVRNAYDEFARPCRMLVTLLVLPLMFIAVRRRPGALPVAAVSLIAAAEVGRRRHGGTRYFPVSAAVLAPAWVIERAICAWLAVVAWLRGGVLYNGHRITKAAGRCS